MNPKQKIKIKRMRTKFKKTKIKIMNLIEKKNLITGLRIKIKNQNIEG
jgi:F0F1-type ATP synthase delta subunit